MVKNDSLSVIAAAVFAVLSSAAVAQTASQRIDASQAAQTSVPGMSGVPGTSGNVSGGATAGAGGTASSAGGAVGSKVDMDDRPGKKGKGKAKGHSDDSDHRSINSQRD